MNLTLLLAPDYWQRVSGFWIPCDNPAAEEIAAAFEGLHDPAMGIDDDVAWSAAAGYIPSNHWRHVARNYLYAKVGDVIAPRRKSILLQRPQDQHLALRTFAPDRITVTGIFRVSETGQYMFQTSINGSRPFLTPLDYEIFPVVR